MVHMTHQAESFVWLDGVIEFALLMLRPLGLFRGNPNIGTGTPEPLLPLAMLPMYNCTFILYMQQDLFHMLLDAWIPTPWEKKYFQNFFFYFHNSLLSSFGQC